MKTSVTGWVGLTLTLTGTAMQALSPTGLLRYSYVVFLVSSAIWATNGVTMHNRPLLLTNTVLFGLNSIALWHYFA